MVFVKQIKSLRALIPSDKCNFALLIMTRLTIYIKQSWQKDSTCTLSPSSEVYLYSCCQLITGQWASWMLLEWWPCYWCWQVSCILWNYIQLCSHGHGQQCEESIGLCVALCVEQGPVITGNRIVRRFYFTYRVKHCFILNW